MENQRHAFMQDKKERRVKKERSEVMELVEMKDEKELEHKKEAPKVELY